jgi:SAM-dependent methyltransferase
MESALAQQYERQDRWRRWEDALKVLPLKPGQRVLDLGCGVGQISKRLANLGARVVGVDGNDDLLGAARAAHPEIRFEKGDLNELSPAQFGRVDGIWSSFVAAYFPQLAPVLARWRDCLVTGGWLALVEMDNLLGHEPLSAELTTELRKFYDSARVAGRYDFESGHRLSSTLKEVGFSILHEGILADDELSFTGRAPADVLLAWRLRLERMAGLKVFLGDRFPDFERAFLDALSSPDHHSNTRVFIVVAQRT